MSTLTKIDIKNFLVNKKGYLKKSPINVAKAIWKRSEKHNLPKNETELKKELANIKEIQATLRLANTVEADEKDTRLMEIYDKILDEKAKPKRRLYFDIEVSPNIVFSWRIGGDIHLSPDDIIEERAVICVCWKWAGETKVHSLQWNNGDDKELLTRFSKIIEGADELVTQNGDSFDIKWLRTRCLYHDIVVSPKFNSIDTLKMARSGFKFNSNKLDYMGKFLGVGSKIKTDYDLWKNITLRNCKKSMNQMVDYCKQDVLLLEEVHQKLQKLSPAKKFKYKKL